MLLRARGYRGSLRSGRDLGSRTRFAGHYVTKCWMEMSGSGFLCHMQRRTTVGAHVHSRCSARAMEFRLRPFGVAPMFCFHSGRISTFCRGPCRTGVNCKENENPRSEVSRPIHPDSASNAGMTFARTPNCPAHPYFVSDYQASPGELR
ncbi:hypothetical protein PYCCODRAFT_1481594 [Trametes coccinea BRFM310]|uniref:Uncharacterized protein n=1 Tax=Trametes coccinea (strain BRFM310) TaxID=1353009 RepID=A0A1Y2I783_TRAC3|nr:hypothetical protein PYCCODRAFT_1481594 [Trametes coccinea BRFM310]